MIRVKHHACGKTAFFFLEKLKAGDPINSSNVLDLKGDKVESGTQIQCFSCGIPFIPGDNTCEQQHWTDWFVVNK